MDGYLLINNKKYPYKCDYKNESASRDSFNKLTEKTYGFNFEQWYNDGHWGERYIPYSILCEDQIVANVSVNIIDFDFYGEQKRFIQIGTVMTDRDFQGQGFSRTLLEAVLKEWENNCDLIYLFANDSVLDFYPKFGFTKIDEYVYSLRKGKEDNSTESMRNTNIRKLNMDNDKDRAILYNLVCNTRIFSSVSMINNPSLIMFHCTYFKKNDIYYLEDYNTAVICDFEEDTLYLHELFSPDEVKLDIIINVIANSEIEKVVLGFIPKDTSGYNMDLLTEEDTTLFIKKGKYNPFENKFLRFPTLSHA
ncbi:GNAT family N-acetyltransferase [Metaclostridioides mangenotii]|uniref:GNAT family N-acetyltransferase n=1 Tax=Metaclostridioides mangenotii TaxID=1540 RepID=UPI000466185D|nr:GNAT family N-acetyltransferase [Clostridioides mangenotii]